MSDSVIRFGSFEVNPVTGELRKSGVRIRLQDQPFKVLMFMLERPGKLVTRDELKQQLWKDAEFGDFDQGLNIAVKKIREALSDSSDTPKFIETLPRRGYRFIAPVTKPSGATETEPGRPSALRIRKWVFAAFTVVLAVILGGWWAARRPHAYSLGIFGPVATFRLAPLTSALGYEFDPEFSPDGKQIVYVWSPGEKNPPNIYVKLLGTGNPVALVPSQEGVARAEPTWSPDGRMIAFVREAATPEDSALETNDKKSVAQKIIERIEKRRPDCGVFVVPSIGGPEKKLFDINYVTGLHWGPDGSWLLLAYRERRDDPPALWRFSLDGTQRQQLTFPPKDFAGDSIPAFSPDGKWIAFSRNWSSGGSDVFIVPVTGGEPRRLTKDAQHLRGLSFSADGREILYSSSRESGERRGLWRIWVEGGTPRRLPFGTENVESPVVSRTGDHLAYVQHTESTKIWSYDVPQGNDKPADPKIAIGSLQMQVGPQFSPDGSRVAFASTRTGSWEIWVSAPDGSGLLQLTSFGDRQTGTPRWSPDGRWIVFDARPEKKSDIYVIDSRGGTPRKLTTGPYDNVVPSFSRDGQWVYYSSNAGGGWNLWKLRVDGQGAPVQVTHDSGFSAFESTDGKVLYYSKWSKPGIYGMPVAGGPEFLVTMDLLPRLWGCWSVSEQGIYLVRPEQTPGSKDLYPVLSFYDFATKSMKNLRPLNHPPNPGPALAVAPDGKSILYTEPDFGGSDIMIVDNFR